MRAPLPVEVVRSARRRKTVQAVLTDGVIKVHVPARMSDREVEDYVAELVPRLERRARSDHIDLEHRASTLAKRFQLPMPKSIEWAENQRRRWGSCQPSSGRIRISAQLAECPPWVLDYVIVHELTHLVHADHSPAFTALVDRYPRAERARGYLLAKGERMASPDSPPIDVDLDVDVDLYAEELEDVDRPDQLDGLDTGALDTLDTEAIDRAFAVVEQAQQEIAEREAAERNGQGQLPLG
jgi:predicted metal-dependent hydrolase